MKKIFRNIHLYLSLAAGIFIMIACLTGSIMVFEEEINHIFHSERYFVKVQKERLPLNTLVKNAELSKKGFEVSGIKAYQQSDRSTEISLSEINNGEPEKKEGRGKPSYTVYVNPYNGKILNIENKRESFFKKVEMIHRFLLSKKEGVGHYIMSYSASFFLFILITGIVLWWPKSNKVLKQRLKIKWDGNTKRLIHDLHVVVGFYTSVFLIIIVMTGLTMSFNWINNGIFTLTNSKKENPKPPKSNYLEGSSVIDFTGLENIIINNFQDFNFYSIRVPKEKDDVFSLNILENSQTENNFSTFYIDQYKGTVINNLAFADKSLGQKIRSYVKPIHTGEIYGLTTKIINFIICLLTLTFPITGVLMWLKRLKKKKLAVKI
ncbi:hypothetical protein A5893_12820 [Pedobacter psychrophilus]|uniref:PepSY domain-containing protein n=1 Tax=Pedobacter psychrophilus TaxID=1826909 RepID=A0A179DCZ2_9SPHI|nr:PepSY-associated TM helix domain-containing protein [Pedobacter psychrophilus]OAQ38915.1 hypothetical protein A5893_12820 [Pedobacter psychrophilus]